MATNYKESTDYYNWLSGTSWFFQERWWEEEKREQMLQFFNDSLKHSLKTGV